jgi:hypothetical protein
MDEWARKVDGRIDGLQLYNYSSDQIRILSYFSLATADDCTSPTLQDCAFTLLSPRYPVTECSLFTIELLCCASRLLLSDSPFRLQ